MALPDGLVQILQEMSKSDLKSLLQHDQILDSFISANISESDTPSLLDNLREQNVSLARSNIDDADRVSKLQREVESLRNHVKQRQESLRPALQRVAAYKQKTSKTAFEEILRSSISDAEARLDAAAAPGESQDADWEAIVSEFIKACKPLHYRRELLERLANNEQ